MQVQLSKWGNSLGLRLPQAFTSQLGLAEGEKVDIRAEGDRIVIERARARYQLADLLVGMTPAALRDGAGVEADWGAPIGREVVDE